MEKYKLHEDIKMLSENVYAPDKHKTTNGWRLIKYVPNSKTGFQGAIYKNGNEVVVIYAGTNQLKDFLKDDIQMGFVSVPNQQTEAHNLYMDAKKMFPKANITLGGHSLGASLAQLESAHTGNSAVTFNAYGTGDILKAEGYKNIKDLNIINYGNPNDIIFGAKYNAQPGRTFITNTNLNPSRIYGIEHSGEKRVPDINRHYLSNMDSLRNAVEVEPAYKNPENILKGCVEKNVFKSKIFTQQEIGDMTSEEFLQNEPFIMQQLKDGLIKPEAPEVDYSGYLNPETGDKKIFSREEIAQMSSDKYSGNEPAITAQLKKIGIPTDTELHSASLAGKTIYVKPYTRSDGTEVRGYYRSI